MDGAESQKIVDIKLERSCIMNCARPSRTVQYRIGYERVIGVFAR